MVINKLQGEKLLKEQYCQKILKLEQQIHLQDKEWNTNLARNTTLKTLVLFLKFDQNTLPAYLSYGTEMTPHMFSDPKAILMCVEQHQVYACSHQFPKPDWTNQITDLKKLDEWKACWLDFMYAIKPRKIPSENPSITVKTYLKDTMN